MSRLGDLRRARRRIGIGRALATAGLLLAALLVARWSWRAPLAIDAERAMYDTRAMIAAVRSPVEQDRRMLLVVFNDRVLAATGKRYPVDRALLARALTQLDRLGARAIGIDVLIDQAQPEDAALTEALRAMRTPVYLAFTTHDATPQVMQDWQEAYERRFVAGLAGSNVRPVSVLFNPDVDGVVRSWPARLASLPPLLADRLAGSADPLGYDHSIAFHIPSDDKRGLYETIDIDTFEDRAVAAVFGKEVAGRPVMIGSDVSDADQFDTPMTRVTHKTATGLQVHAAMLAQRLDGRKLTPLAGWALWGLALLVVVAGGAVGMAELTGWRFGLALAAPLAAIVAIPFALQARGLDTQGLPAFGWIVGWTLAYSAAATAARGLGSEQRRYAAGALGKYLPRDVAAAILRDPEQLSLRGERRTIFALFSDLEGSTELAHGTEPETAASLLNRYLDRLSNVVLAYGGTIDKFVGDAVVAFWGAPIARADDGDRALGAAVAMVEAGEAFRRETPAGAPPIGRTRVGLHRGDAIVGNFGGEGRMQYTAIGDAMNAASRLEGANKTLKTRALVSADAAAAMTDPPLRPMGRVRLRGRATPVAVFEPIMPGEDSAELSALLARHDAGDGTALDDLDRYAATRDGDVALRLLSEHCRQVGPGGCLVLD